jgi:hypothetical protein
MTVITMSRTEIDRMSVLRDLAASRIRVTEAATLMRLGRRQVFRLAKAYGKHVPFGQGAAATWPEESYVQGRIDGTPGRRVARSGNFTRRPLERQVSTPTHRKAAILLPPSDISNWRKS